MQPPPPPPTPPPQRQPSNTQQSGRHHSIVYENNRFYTRHNGARYFMDTGSTALLHPPGSYPCDMHAPSFSIHYGGKTTPFDIHACKALGDPLGGAVITSGSVPGEDPDTGLWGLAPPMDVCKKEDQAHKYSTVGGDACVVIDDRDGHHLVSVLDSCAAAPPDGAMKMAGPNMFNQKCTHHAVIDDDNRNCTWAGSPSLLDTGAPQSECISLDTGDRGWVHGIDFFTGQCTVIDYGTNNVWRCGASGPGS